MVSPRKSSSSLGCISEGEESGGGGGGGGGGGMMPHPAKSCDSLYSTNSSTKNSMSGTSCGRNGGKALYSTPAGSLYGRKNRQGSFLPSNSSTDVRQRVLSARRLRIKTYQNQLIDAQNTIQELLQEIRVLRTLHKRQDSALAKYENAKAELPKLLHSHAEELRVWQTKFRTLQAANRELEMKIKHKEHTILQLQDQNRYYAQLNKEKCLDERQRLTEKLHTLEQILQEKDHDMQMMARRAQLEQKNYKQHLAAEQKRTKEALLKLEKARLELSGYRKLDQLNTFGAQLVEPSIRRKPQFENKEPRSDKPPSKKAESECDDDGGNDGHSTADDETDVQSVKSTCRVKEPPLDPDQPTPLVAINSVRNSIRSGQSGQTTDRASGHTLTHNTVVNVQSTLRANTRHVFQGNGRLSAAALGGNVRRYNKQRMADKPVAGKPHGQQYQYQSTTTIRRRVERGDGDAPVMSGLKTYTGRMMQRNSAYRKEVTEKPTPLDYEEEYDEYDDLEVPRNTKEPEEGQYEYIEANVYDEEDEYIDNGDEKQGSDDNISVQDLEEGREEEEHVTREEMENAENSGHLRCEIVHLRNQMGDDFVELRKQIKDDFKDREAFLDTFCRKTAESGEVTTPKRSTGIPTVRKHKLLAALRSIDNVKGQD